MKTFKDLEIGAKFTDPASGVVPPIVYVKASEDGYYFDFDRLKKTEFKVKNLDTPVFEYVEPTTK